MTLTDVGQFYYPFGTVHSGGADANLTDGIQFTFNDANDAWAYGFQARGGNIIGASFAVRTVASGETLTIEIWGKGADGKPDSVKTSCTVDQLISTAQTSYEVTFGAVYASTLGEELFLVIRSASGWTSGDIDLADLDRLPLLGSSPPVATSANAGSTWTLADLGSRPSVGVEYTGNRWYPLAAAQVMQDVELTPDVDATTDEVGLKFELPFDAVITGVVGGAELDVDATFAFYEGAEAPGAGETVHVADTDFRSGTAMNPYCVMFDAAQTVVKDTVYRVTMARSSGTISLANFMLPHHQAKESWGIPYAKRTNWLLCTENGASWDDSTYALYLPLMSLIISQVHDDDAGGGGGGTDSILGGGSLTGGFA